MTRWRLVAGAVALLAAGCAARVPRPAPLPTYAPPPAALPRIEYSVQVGAFAEVDNALRLITTLGQRGLEAFYFVGADGLHRVRFGSFPTKELATQRAEAFRSEQVIDAFYVVPPEPLTPMRRGAGLRRQVVDAAMSFLGWPYRWGGPSPETGFDCSGLTMTAYRLSGLALPRTAAEQYTGGERVTLDGLQEGDLVFFATEGGGRPSHVGLYVGAGRFIHAPGRGGVVRLDPLTDAYYQRRFLAGRSFL
jgi:hypothetical protein